MRTKEIVLAVLLALFLSAELQAADAPAPNGEIVKLQLANVYKEIRIMELEYEKLQRIKEFLEGEVNKLTPAQPAAAPKPSGKAQ